MKTNWLIELSKQTNGLIREVTTGLVRLDGALEHEQGKSLRRKAILCKSGSWEGMFGPVDVTREMLEALAGRYNREREKVINENDYVPILVDHERRADHIKGRLDISTTKLSVELVSDPGEVEVWALVGEVRIDDEDAVKKVIKGVYAQLSISFNEETFELYEVSFVAVEAARRSIILTQGEKKVNLEKLNAKVSSLQQKMKAGAANRTALCALMGTNLGTTKQVIDEMDNKLKATVLSLKKSALLSTFNGFIAQGKLTKADFDKINLEAFCSMESSSLQVVLEAYSSRTPSTDFVQFGKTGQTPIDDKSLKSLTKDGMKVAMEAQKKGVHLAGAVPGDDEDEAKKKVAAEAGDDKEVPESDMPSFKEVEKVIEDLNALEGQVTKFGELYKSMKETLGKLNGLNEDKDEE